METKDIKQSVATITGKVEEHRGKLCGLLGMVVMYGIMAVVKARTEHQSEAATE